MKVAETRLDKAEFYRRFDTLVPGDAAPGGTAPTVNAEIFFERLTIDGLEEMHRYSVDERFYEFFEFSPFVSIDETRAYIEKLQRRMGNTAADRTAMYWFVRRKADGYLVGTANLIGLNYRRQSIEWGYGVDPQLWGHGYVLLIQETLKHYVFEVLGLNRLQGMTILENERTISSVLSAGMKHEGTLRQYYCKDGQYRDAWIYGMLAEDYFQQKESGGRSDASYKIEDVISIVSSVLVEDEINEASTSLNVASWDSLSHMSIMLAISEKTGIRFVPHEITRANSVRTILSILNNSR